MVNKQFLNATILPGESDERCSSIGGYCMEKANCPGGNYEDNKCPGGNNIKCCLAVPFQEPECEAEGGTCVDKCGCEGEPLHGFCPSQPNSVKCCKKADTTTPSFSGITEAPGASGTTLNCPPVVTTTISVSVTTECIKNRVIRSSGCSSKIIYFLKS